MRKKEEQVNNRQKQIFEKRGNNIINNSKQDFKKLNYNLELQQIMQWGAAYPHVAAAFLVKSIDGKDCGYMYEKTLHIR